MENHREHLQAALIVFGVVALLLYPLMAVWPSGWVWNPPQHEY